MTALLIKHRTAELDKNEKAALTRNDNIIDEMPAAAFINLDQKYERYINQRHAA